MITATELLWIQSIQQTMASHPVLIPIAIFCARWAIFLNVPLWMLFYWKKIGKRHDAMEACWVFVISLFTATVISRLTNRPRPFQADSDLIHLYISAPWNASYPSGHTSVAFALAFIFLYANPKWGWVSLVLAILTACGRIAVGVHFPTDIVAGMVVAFVAFAFVRLIHQQLFTGRMNKIARNHRHDG